jgi:glycosyltransferase involved in cell wall biosynthesis
MYPTAGIQMSAPLVSIIMAAYNNGRYIAAAITSALDQEHRKVELIVVNDGSTDGSADLLAGHSDPRVKVITLDRNMGVSNARNRALDLAQGDYVCFLDADDLMPARSLTARLEVFRRDPSSSFVDGVVEFRETDMRNTTRTWTPSFKGEPLGRLVRFDPCCFFGNTWMIRRDAIGDVRFDTSLTHAEDLQFYIRLAPGRQYDFTTETVLHYRITGTSSMSRLEMLERSYRALLTWMRAHPETVPRSALLEAGYRVRRMMSGAYWKAGRIWNAIMAWR